MEFKILPVEQIIGNILYQNRDVINRLSPSQQFSYSWGDQQELNQWIIAKDEEISGMRAFSMTNETKYPLIWMVTPVEGEIRRGENFLKDVTFIICSDTKAEWLNQTREKETMPLLVDIANEFLNILGRDKNAEILRNNGQWNVKFTKVYNYPVSSTREYVKQTAESETLDNWDAIKLKFDLRINNNCLKTIQQCL